MFILIVTFVVVGLLVYLAKNALLQKVGSDSFTVIATKSLYLSLPLGKLRYKLFAKEELRWSERETPHKVRIFEGSEIRSDEASIK